MFEIRRGVLQPSRTPNEGDQLFMCWPVLVYRVIAPVIKVRHLNIIERVVLALCRGGVRHPPDIAARIHQDGELCIHILDQLRKAGKLDKNNVPTEAGLETLRTSRVGEEPELIVTHVFQDPVARRLWPRTADGLVFQPVRNVNGDQARLRLNTAGEARWVTAHVLNCSIDPGKVRPPTAQEVIDAVGAHRQAEITRRANLFGNAQGQRQAGARLAEEDLQALTTELTVTSGHTVHQVLEIGPAMPEYLLVWLHGKDPETGRWQAADPFGLNPNPLVQRLLAERVRDDPGTAQRVMEFADTAEGRLRHAYRAAGAGIRANAERRLVQTLGPELRGRTKALDLLLELEEAATRGGDAGVESVARAAYRLYEYLFRLLAGEFSLPARPSWDGGSTSPAAPVVAAALNGAVQYLGFNFLPDRYVKPLDAIRKYPTRLRDDKDAVDIKSASVNKIIPYLLIAAADSASPHRGRHPLQELAKRRPTLLNDLVQLGDLRNRGSHGERDATVEDDVEWCRSLALEAARQVVDLPALNIERNG
ncbi:hypothetical protein GCM10009527_047790 [Actinomadura nitritigenes]|uniref:DUF4145 domain-containing protein n=1 Tax=Actinomadura nitritigenes TaxID=134602 RepID=A0ABS3QTJ5_9ACTN|nr:hypothetical protein [Actinomadura nitritigenes]MBO2437307.1 hypothetical protein [Actinomadura nitritigenes]